MLCKHYWVACDGPGCPHDGPHAGSIAEAYVAAGRAGWKAVWAENERVTRYLCPDCQKEDVDLRSN